MRDRIVEGSGNVFADLGLAHADELLTKAHLMRRIGEIIKGRHLTQAHAAELLETTQPIVSNLMRGRISGFSFERLVRFLNALDRDVEIVVKRKPRRRPKARLKVRLTG